MSNMNGKTAVVVGASRGLGRGVASAVAAAGATVIAVARSAVPQAEPADDTGNIQPVVADASDASAAGALLDRYEPDALILVAGAQPAHASAAAADLGDVLGQLEHRCAHRISLVAGDAYSSRCRPAAASL